MDPELWFGEWREDVQRARAACLRCPIRRDCLYGALERRETAGVWGGALFTSRGKPAKALPPPRPRPARPPAELQPGNPEPGQRQRRSADVDPDRVAAAVAGVRARLLDSGDGLTRAERIRVIRAVYPGMPRALLAELLGCSERTVDRAAAANPDDTRKAA